MRIKCVGGPMDGRMVDLPEGFPVTFERDVNRGMLTAIRKRATYHLSRGRKGERILRFETDEIVSRGSSFDHLF